MSPGDVFLLVVRWAHGLAALAWIGGSLFYFLVLRPALRRGGDVARPLSELAAREFRGVVDTCILVLLLTGVILTFDRLTSPHADVAYVTTLVVKITLALTMFALARARSRRGLLPLRASPSTPSAAADPPAPAKTRLLTRTQQVARAVSGANLILILGIAVFLLADLLMVLYEGNVTGD